MGLIYTIVVTLLTLGVLVTVHEWGHFYVARRCGIKVLKFSVGFGRPIFSKIDKYGTEYIIATIPLGGYVKMLDEREAPVPKEQLAYAFNSKPLWQRIAVVAAGPLINLVFALLVYWFMFMLGVQGVVPVIGEIKEMSPAAQANIQANYEIVAIDGQNTPTWNEVNLRLAEKIGETGTILFSLKEIDSASVYSYPVIINDWMVDTGTESPVSALGIMPWLPKPIPKINMLDEKGVALAAGLRLNDLIVTVNSLPVDNWKQVVELVHSSPDIAMIFGIMRNQQLINIRLIPAIKVDESGKMYGYIGAGVQAPVFPDKYKRSTKYGVFAAAGKAWNKTGQMISLTLGTLWKMVKGAVSLDNLSGPITIAKVAGKSAASGLEPYLYMLAYLSISLGILNLLPIPVLDGGHLLYYGIELLTGKPVSEYWQLLGLKIGMIVLLSLMTLSLFNDFMRL